MDRNLYLTNTPVDEALGRYSATLEPHLKPRFERIPVTESLGRVTKDAVYALCCSPLFNAAAMDGIAVRAAITAGASDSAPVTLQIVKGNGAVEFAGQTRDIATAIVVNTGNPVSDPWDAVIMAEDLVALGDGDSGENIVEIREAASPWQHVRPIGEDIVTGEMIVPSRHTIRPMDIGVLLAGGVTEVEVYAKPRVAVIPTGTEIVSDLESTEAGSIIDSNGPMLAALVTANGGIADRSAPVTDDYALIKAAVTAAVAKSDVVLVIAGSSAGTEDFTAPVIADLGSVIVHGVAMKPGKPIILGLVKGTPVIGIPGYPVSAYLAYGHFAAPVISVLAGTTATDTVTVTATLTRRLVSSLKHREYVRVKVGRVEDRLVASPLARGAGAAMSLVRADGFCVIPQNSEGVEAGGAVEVELYRSLADIHRTLVAIGSHDLILDVIGDLMASAGNAPYFLSSTHVGSMGGLMALKRGECHIAPTHLLDEDTGVYNVAYLKKLFGSDTIALIKGVGRVQGIMVAQGNPLGIKDVTDLPGNRYINRQKGAGTRLFLDYRLKCAGVGPAAVPGYDREAATHMAVAIAVQSGSADAGMGISSAAASLGLGFVPLGEEEYDFAIPKGYLELPMVQTFIAALKSAAFRGKLASLGGYTWAHCGEVVSPQF